MIKKHHMVLLALVMSIQHGNYSDHPYVKDSHFFVCAGGKGLSLHVHIYYLLYHLVLPTLVILYISIHLIFVCMHVKQIGRMAPQEQENGATLSTRRHCHHTKTW